MVSALPIAHAANSKRGSVGEIAVGTAPVNWNNDDLPNWRPRVHLETVLAEAAAAGYAGIEYGAEFPSDPTATRRTLDTYGLALAGSYRWLHLSDDARFSGDLSALEQSLAGLAAAGCNHLIVADSMTPARIAIAGRVPEDGSSGLDDGGWTRLSNNLRTVAALARAQGLATHYHNHVGSFVETAGEVQRLRQQLSPGLVDLCFDTGHFAYGGGDPTEFIRSNAREIGYLHLKDVDPAVLAGARRDRLGFLDALMRYVFCEFGQGIVDIPGAIESLRVAGFAGWAIVEQDTSPNPSAESAAASRRFLRERCAL